MILSNVRMPDKVAGDLNAQLNANRAGAERFAAMFREQGASRMKAVFDQILAASEARMRELIAAMPDGTYSFDDCVDDYGPGTATCMRPTVCSAGIPGPARRLCWFGTGRPSRSDRRTWWSFAAAMC